MIRWRTPSWWYSRNPAPPMAAAFLTPLALIWEARTAARIASTTPTDPGAPVICVGNLTAGGSGKTPVAMEIACLISETGSRPFLLASGYGGRGRGLIDVDPDRHSARDVGDETLLLRQAAPVIVARNRLAGARLAVDHGAQVIVMDDGHQNPAVRKSLSLVVIDGETRDGEWPFGAGGVVPAGPMREPLSVGLARADIVIVVLPLDVAEIDPDLRALFVDKPLWIARWSAVAPPPGGPCIGFAGVAKPWKVERALRAAGCDLIDFVSFPDHAPMTDAALRKLTRRAAKRQATLVTTEKDWVRLDERWRKRVVPWIVRVRFDDEPQVRAALTRAVNT